MNSKPHILIVEPNEGNQQVLRQTLGDMCDMTVVRRGRSAMEFLCNSVGCDLVLLDTENPEADAFQLLADMTSLFPQLPVVVTLSVQEVRAFVTLMELGAADYVVKPFHPTELRFLIHHLLDGCRRPVPEIDDGAVVQIAC